MFYLSDEKDSVIYDSNINGKEWNIGDTSFSWLNHLEFYWKCPLYWLNTKISTPLDVPDYWSLTISHNEITKSYTEIDYTIY